MAKLYFKYGTMGSSKTAQALITKYNYEEKDMRVWLLKPAIDSRDGKTLIRSRIGLEAPAEVIGANVDIQALLHQRKDIDVIIVDECQFMTTAQINQLRRIVDEDNLPVLCFGLRTDFLTNLFEGSRRLFELADSLTEIKSVCNCGAKSTTNVRIDDEGYIVTEGDQVMMGGNDRYMAMCFKCRERHIREHLKVK